MEAFILHFSVYLISMKNTIVSVWRLLQKSNTPSYNYKRRWLIVDIIYFFTHDRYSKLKTPIVFNCIQHNNTKKNNPKPLVFV